MVSFPVNLILQSDCASVERLSTSGSLAALFPRRPWLLFEHRELNLLLHRINPVHQHTHAIAHVIGLARTLADDLARAFVVGVAVVSERVERDQALDEEVGELHEESELGYADDQAVEIFSDAALHELHFLPFHQAAFGFVGAAFGLAGFVGDVVEFSKRNRTAERFESVLMGGVITTFGPRRRRRILAAVW